MKSRLLSAAIISLLLAACNLSVNRTVTVRDGRSAGSLNSVNGSILIGSRCDIHGNCHTVNGRIEVGEDSRVKGLKTVNGRIELDARVVAEGDLETVNGAIRCRQGTTVDGDVTTINGDINLQGAAVDEDLSTINGDITLQAKSLVRGDILIRGQRRWNESAHSLEIRIGEGSVVKGDIRVRDSDRRVRVILESGGTVLGRIENAEVVKE